MDYSEQVRQRKHRGRAIAKAGSIEEALEAGTIPQCYDQAWGRELLTQPAAIKAAVDWTRKNEVVCFSDAGDVQANGFQIAEDDKLGRSFTDTGASYIGFAVSSLLVTAMTSEPSYGLALSGDGSFVMNPQILIDGVQHSTCGCTIVFDNRSMK